MITTILNVYRRPYYLKEQIEAIRNQTIKSKEIWIWVNANEDNVGFDFDSLGVDKIIRSNFNFKYHGRFSLGLLAKTQYVSFFDDDTIPGDMWYENCLNCQKIKPSILVGVGIVFEDRYNYARFGWPSNNLNMYKVDYGGHAWFVPKTTLNTMWIETPTLENCEDMQISYNNLKYCNIETFCPPHPIDNKRLWSSLSAVEKGNDNKASSNGSLMPISEFFNQRNSIVDYYISNGWKTVRGVK